MNPEGVSPKPAATTGDLPAEEGAGAKVLPVPVRPTQQEVDLHNATHVPFRSWCPFCVSGKAKSHPHFSKSEERESDIPVVSLDYAFLGEEEGDADDETELTAEQKDGTVLKVLVMKDRKSKYIIANVVPRKGDHPYVVQRVGEDLTQILGYDRVIFKSDQEPAIKKLKAAVRREYSVALPEEQSAVGDSQSNGEIEMAVQMVEGQVRTLKSQLESRLNRVIPADNNLLPWLVRHAGALLSRYHQSSDGMTAYRRLRGRNYDRVITEFGECI